jgi:chromosome segregation ATPase
MTRIRILGLCLVAMFALSAMVTSVAQAQATSIGDINSGRTALHFGGARASEAVDCPRLREEIELTATQLTALSTTIEEIQNVVLPAVRTALRKVGSELKKVGDQLHAVDVKLENVKARKDVVLAELAASPSEELEAVLLRDLAKLEITEVEVKEAKVAIEETQAALLEEQTELLEDRVDLEGELAALQSERAIVRAHLETLKKTLAKLEEEMVC